jgi:hypothetical protein
MVPGDLASGEGDHPYCRIDSIHVGDVIHDVRLHLIAYGMDGFLWAQAEEKNKLGNLCRNKYIKNIEFSDVRISPASTP